MSSKALSVSRTVVLAMTLGAFAHAATTYQWVSTSNADWNTGANWTPNTGFPSAGGDIASLTNTGTANATALNASSTADLGGITVNDDQGGTYTFAGSALNLRTTANGGTAAIDISGGTTDATIGNALANTTSGTGINPNLGTNVATGRTLTFNGNVSLANAASWTKTGLGSVTYAAAGGNTRIITVTGGLLDMTGNPTTSAVTINNTGTFKTRAGFQRFNSTTVNYGGTLYIRAVGGTGYQNFGTMTVQGGAIVTMESNAIYLLNGGVGSTIVHDGTGSATVTLGGVGGISNYISNNSLPLGNAGLPLGYTPLALNVADSLAPTDLSIGAIIGKISSGGTLEGIRVTMSGLGTAALTAANVYTGSTLVTAGTLLVNNTAGSGTGTGNVDVSAGATIGGTGTIKPDGTNSVTVGGFLAPGANLGILTFDLGSTSGNVTLSPGAALTYELALPGQGDQTRFLNFTAGDLVLNSNPVNILPQYGFGVGDYTLLTFAGGSAPTSGLTIGSGFGPFVLSTIEYRANDIVLHVLPEPATSVLLLLGILALFRRRA